jgi:hypothetical protein
MKMQPLYTSKEEKTAKSAKKRAEDDGSMVVKGS